MTEDEEERTEYSITDPETGKPSMCAEMCATCIFRPDSPVTKGLRKGRLRQLINDTRRRESYIVCHSTFTAQPAICRGFYDRYSTNLLRILERLGGFVMINAPKEKTNAAV